MTESPIYRFIPTRRHIGVELLASALQELPTREAFILLLRYCLGPHDHDQSERSRREVSEMLELSVSRVAHLERDGLARLRQRLMQPGSSLWSCIDEDRTLMEDHSGRAMV